MKPTISLAYSYVRFSHPDQAKGDSYRRQTELRDNWLEGHPAVRLDTSLTLEDRGVSAFTGEHRDNPDRHAMAAFVALVKKGRVERGSYLIVENLDRLSREDIIPALSLLLELIQSGIRVVQLLPAVTVFDATANPMQLMMAIMELSRGHSESQMKSERVGRKWKEKKLDAASGHILTARAPAWLKLVDGKWKVSGSAAATIRRIFKLAIEGYGLGVITKKLNAEKVPLIGHAPHWARSYVGKLLTNRAIVGEYQPYKGRGAKREKDGKPIAGYYPGVITEDEWYAARAAVASRKGRAGRLPQGQINIFTGLLRDARNGGTLHQINKGEGNGGRLLISYKAFQGADGAKSPSFPLSAFETGLLSCLRELDSREIMPDDPGEGKTLALVGRLGEVEAEIEKLKGRLQSKGYSDALADVLDRQEARRRRLTQELADARQQAANPLGTAWKECKSLVDILNAAPDAEATRVRLRAALRRMVEGIWCLFIDRGPLRVAAVQVWFAGGAHRDYVVARQAATGGAVGTRPPKMWVRSLALPGSRGELDLRKPEDAKTLVEAMEAVSVTELNEQEKPSRCKNVKCPAETPRRRKSA